MDLVEALRLALGIEQGGGSTAAMARRLGVSQSVLSRFFSGKTLSLENLSKICRRSVIVRNHVAEHLLGMDGKDADVWEVLGREFGGVLSIGGAYRLLTILREQKDAGALDEEFAVLRAAASHVRSALSAQADAGKFGVESSAEFD